MKKIVLSLFPLVLVVICSVSAFALVLDSGNTNPNYSHNLKYLDVFDTVYKSDAYTKNYSGFKDKFDKEISFMQGNQYICVYYRSGGFMSVYFADKEIFYNPSKGSWYLHNDLSSSTFKYASFDFFDLPKLDHTVDSFMSRSLLLDSSLQVPYYPFSYSPFGNSQSDILYSNFDIRDMEGNILFPATEKTHNTPLPPYQGDIAVKWKDFGNRAENTAENEYLSFSGNALNFEINIGSVLGRSEFVFTEVATGATQTVSCNKFNEVGINQTFDFSIDLRKNVVLKKDTKYTVDFVHVNVFNVKTVVSRVGILVTADIFDLNERKVSWTKFGNRTTAKGEYLPLNDLFIDFQLYTGNVDNHRYGVYIQEYNNQGQKVDDMMTINSELFASDLKANTTYNFSVYLQKHVNLYKGKKYVFNLVDLTSAEYVASIGFSPTINIQKNFIVPPNIETVAETEGDTTDTEIRPNPPGGTVLPSDEFPDTGSILDKIMWFFGIIVKAIEGCFDVFIGLVDTLAGLCSGIIRFISVFFPYLPKEVTACLSLSLVAIIILRFLKR